MTKCINSNHHLKICYTVLTTIDQPKILILRNYIILISISNHNSSTASIAAIFIIILSIIIINCYHHSDYMITY